MSQHIRVVSGVNEEKDGGMKTEDRVVRTERRTTDRHGCTLIDTDEE